MPSLQSRRHAIWANGQTPVFFPLLGPFPARNFQPVMFAYELGQATSSELEIKAAAQFSADGLTWPSAAVVTLETAYNNTAGWTYGDSFENISDPTLDSRGLLRFGAVVHLNTGSSLAYARLQLFIEAREG